MTPLERSHAELRAAVILAGRHIRKLTFGRRNDPALAKLRAVLWDARLLSKRVYRVPLLTGRDAVGGDKR